MKTLVLLAGLCLSGCLAAVTTSPVPPPPSGPVAIAPSSPPPPPPPAAAPVPQPVARPYPAPREFVVVPVAPPPEPLPADAIVAVYLDVLGRGPAPAEVRAWRDRSFQQPLSPDDVRHELLDSREFRALTPETVIRRAYWDYARRPPSPEEMRRYRRCVVDDHWTYGRVQEAIAHDVRTGPDPAARREEARERDREPAGNGGPGGGRRSPAPAPAPRGDRRDAGENPHSPDAIIDRAYDDLLERKPDRAGYDRYRQLLAHGASEADIRAQIRQSEEYRVTLPDAKTTRAYREVLGRDPDASGMESYRRKIVDHGWTEEDVKNDLRKSAEYRSRKPS